MFPSVSVVIPMYNEEEYVSRTLTAVTAALERAGIEHEIVLVDDASTDRTAALADAAAAADPRVRVVHNPQNLTLGGSLRAGFAAARHELVLYTDADLPFDLEEVPRAVRLLQVQEADMLVAYRFDRTAEGMRRALYTWGYSVIIRALFGLKIRDVNFAFKLFRRRLLDRFVAEERRQLHRRRAGRAHPQGGRPDHPDRRRLLPAHARRVEARLGQGDRPHPLRALVALARAALRPAVTRAARVGAGALVGLLATLFALSYGLRYGVHNQHTYLLRAVRRADPTLFARDWLVGRTTDYHPAWSVLAGWLLATGHGPWLLAAGNALVLCAAALLVYAMARSLAVARALPVMVLVLGYTVFDAQHEVVGSVAVSALFTNYLVPANLGSLGLLAAVALHLRGRFLLAGLAAAAGGLFHANFLVLAPPVLLAAHLPGAARAPAGGAPPPRRSPPRPSCCSSACPSSSP